MPTLYVLPMHRAAWAAKEIATLDVLAGGRVTLTVGVGGREQDYRAAEAPFAGRFAKLDAQVDELRRLWAGEPIFEGGPPLGPAPMQPGGPPLWSGAMGPKSLARASRWAEGVAGFSMAGDVEEVERAFAAADAAWQAAGNPTPPRRVTSFWYALGEGAEERLRRYVFEYLEVFGADVARAMAERPRIHSREALCDLVTAIRELGCDELILVPTNSDPAELDRTLEALS